MLDNVEQNDGVQQGFVEGKYIEDKVNNVVNELDVNQNSDQEFEDGGRLCGRLL